MQLCSCCGKHDDPLDVCYLVEVVLQVSKQADVELGYSLLVHYVLTLNKCSTQLLKLLQTLRHVPDLHGIADGLDQVGELLKPGQHKDVKVRTCSMGNALVIS